MAHILSIEVPTISNAKVLRVFDTSIWDPSITVSSISLDIIPPGYTNSTTFVQAKGFDRLFNSSNLNISGDMSNLPDGIYIIRLTADSEWVEYNHLRQVCLLQDYYKALCTLEFYPCDTLDVNLEEKREELSIIKSYIDAAKAKVEWCNSPSEGIDLHNYAKSRLAKFSLNKCKTC